METIGSMCSKEQCENTEYECACQNCDKSKQS